jgi:hypothetical protein
MRLRAVSHGTPIVFWPRALPPNAILLVTQLTRPKSQLAEIGERRILLAMRSLRRNVLMVQAAKCG